MVLDDKIVEQHGLVVAAVYAIITVNPIITHAEIATYCHISVPSVKRALSVLQQCGYIKVKNNKPNPNTYEILRTKSPEYNYIKGVTSICTLMIKY